MSPSNSLALGAAIRVPHCCREHAIPPCHPSWLLRAAGGTVYVGSEDSKVYALNAGTGSVR